MTDAWTARIAGATYAVMPAVGETGRLMDFGFGVAAYRGRSARRARSPWYCIVQAHLVRRLVARPPTGPERRQPQHTARLAHLHAVDRFLSNSQPGPRRRNGHGGTVTFACSMGSARLSYHDRSGAPGRNLPPAPCRGSSAVASRSLSA